MAANLDFLDFQDGKYVAPKPYEGVLPTTYQMRGKTYSFSLFDAEDISRLDWLAWNSKDPGCVAAARKTLKTLEMGGSILWGDEYYHLSEDAGLVLDDED